MRFRFDAQQGTRDRTARSPWPESLGQRSDASRGPGLRGRPAEAAATPAPRHSGKGLEEETLTRTQSPLEKRNLSTLTDSPTHLVTISLHPFLHSL